ncbi:MAG: NlpC/P60 family protein [Clostridia bacterium]|nr:NlpC/P60 family protein [Clostridia bacterium]
MFKLKKILCTTAAVIAAFCVFTSAALADTLLGTVYCSTYLNARSAGSTGASVVGRLPSGARVAILGSSGSWYKIALNGGSAWVSRSYVTLTGGKAQTVINAAVSLNGVKYVYGGTTASGIDCSGLVVYSFAKAGITLPHSAAQQATKGTAVAKANLRPGDLVFFDTDGGHNNITHVGIYLGGQSFISAQSGAGKVMEASLTNSYWAAAYMSARRIVS